jgi:hypothetical protein
VDEHHARLRLRRNAAKKERQKEENRSFHALPPAGSTLQRKCRTYFQQLTLNEGSFLIRNRSGRRVKNDVQGAKLITTPASARRSPGALLSAHRSVTTRFSISIVIAPDDRKNAVAVRAVRVVF